VVSRGEDLLQFVGCEDAVCVLHFLSRSFMAHSISASRLARYVVVGFSVL